MKRGKLTINDFYNRLGINWIGQGDQFTGYLCNLKPHKSTDEQNNESSRLLLYFIDEKGECHKTTYNYEPYFFIIVKSDIIL